MKRSTLMFLVCVYFVGLLGSGLAINYLWSNTVHETVQTYAQQLVSSNEFPTAGETVTFTAYVTLDGLAAGGVTVTFYKDGVEMGTAITTLDGIATFDWTADVSSDWVFSIAV